MIDKPIDNVNPLLMNKLTKMKKKLCNTKNTIAWIVCWIVCIY